jgi:hypothetical protein
MPFQTCIFGHKAWIAEVVLCDLVVSVLAIGPTVCAFKPGRERYIFKGDKNP